MPKGDGENGATKHNPGNRRAEGEQTDSTTHGNNGIAAGERDVDGGESETRDEVGSDVGDRREIVERRRRYSLVLLYRCWKS